MNLWQIRQDPTMKTKLPNPNALVLVGVVVTILVAGIHLCPPRTSWANPGSSPQVANQTEGYPPSQVDGLMRQAVGVLESHYSIAARVRQSVNLFGKQPVGSGLYFERRTQEGPMFRLELRLRLDNEILSMLDVSDGRYLWQYRKLREDQTLTRLDLQRLVEVLDNAGKMPQPGDMEQWPGTGGLARLLRGLYTTFDFYAVEGVVLRQQLRAWKVEGRWRGDKLARALPSQEKAIRSGGPVNLTKLPEYLPDQVILFLGADDLFPYRIEYHRHLRKKDAKEAQGEDQLLVAIDLFEVSLNRPIDPGHFIYGPGSLPFIDQTDNTLQSMGVKK
jgi:hypothetical protein